MRFLEELRSCRIISLDAFTSIEKRLVWVNRQDPSIVIEKKTSEVLLVDGQVPLKLPFSPEAPSSAPPLPPFVLSWDSAENNVKRENESREATSHELQYQQNTVASLRSARAGLAAHSKNNRNQSIREQVNKAGEQMLCQMRKYEPENMLQATARRAFKGVLSGADKAQADAAVDMKMNERKKQTTCKGPSLGEILLREQKWSSEPTRHETELAKKQAATTEDKLRGVVFEIKFDGQNGR